ncbi:dynamin family protein [Hydrogenimonas sp.]
MDIVECSEQLDELVVTYDLTESAEGLKREFGVEKSDDLKKALEALEKEDRLLKIGVVGRVKAGKSSLLNALIFDGEEVLPKAATPMTAALVTMEYAERIEAEVEFFSEEDIEDIKREHDEYNRRLEALTKRKLEELSKKKRLGGKNSRELLEKAQRQAKRELKQNERLVSSYDQYTRIEASGISAGDLRAFGKITADSREELNEKLREFVGAEGKYMPFTKSVTLRLDEAYLEDLQIVDTPGVNDPVASREERTRALLKDCDVVFIVSPAGQFLSNEDMDLLDRIRSKEGIGEIHIVASQIDNQLHGSERELGGGILPEVLDNITRKLTEHMRSVFENDEYIKKSDIFEKLRKNRVLHSSGLCHSLAKKLGNKERFDSGERHVWDLLQRNYGDYFDDDAVAAQNLKLLANMEGLEKVLREIKAKKRAIMERKRRKYLEAKEEALQKYRAALIEEVKERIAKIENTTKEELQAKKSGLRKIVGKAESAVNDEFDELLEELDGRMREALVEKINAIFRKIRGDISEAEDIETEYYDVSISTWWKPWTWGETETRSRSYTTARAGFVRNSLENMKDDIERIVEIDVREILREWKKDMLRRIIRTLRESAGDENLELDMIDKTIKKVLNTIKYPEVEYSGSLPSNLRKSGTLTGSEAERFLKEADDYVDDLKQTIKRDIGTYVELLVGDLSKIRIGKEIFRKYEADIEELEENILNQELALERYGIIVNVLEKACT